MPGRRITRGTIARKLFFAREKGERGLQSRQFCPYFAWVFLSQIMPSAKNKHEARLQELILEAKRLDIEVRSEKLLREAGYRTKSGSCRVKGQNLILLDRDARVSEQIEFLAGELAARQINRQ